MRVYADCVENHPIDQRLVSEVRNYRERSILRGFDAEMETRLGRTMVTYPIPMNAELPGEVGRAHAPLARMALDASEEEWVGRARQHALGEQAALNEAFLRDGRVFYAVPFAERPDASFLERPRRRRQGNIDDTPNPTIEAA